MSTSVGTYEEAVTQDQAFMHAPDGYCDDKSHLDACLIVHCNEAKMLSINKHDASYSIVHDVADWEIPAETLHAHIDRKATPAVKAKLLQALAWDAVHPVVRAKLIKDIATGGIEKGPAAEKKMVQLVAKIARTADMSTASSQTIPRPNISMAFKSSIPRPIRKVQV
ncbi:hypothetical protein LTR91_023249 [Friedmanniomyces endolithicus]|uniref:Uncharacterized protein n=1 Tax=Friedmanniomyces endolithicus TaxID=329885 RepID=A0AAN6H3E6_9PEZI|nr:hypothetical protein LTR94_017548 [Friedmanniomyces endolithicus]KAK0772419.1 hypothetical protein LTR59_015679 [Friedmanniomyces endolithicus]KAK0782348.1 hypothetical protein LTR38_013410 [Friedmanniomyces endolithicus]KAK0813495.1 hypothetical protein LTR75_004589 [Friedmanniomyces endolithicus]KAK0842697.1 hypothetical protein LTS02_016388 [Friedmanniomyces endolithicus]